MPRRKRLPPVPQETLDKFWEDMQKVLNDNQFDLDLNSKNDVGRLRIATIHKTNCTSAANRNFFMEAEVSAKFALVDDDNFNPDIATDEEILRHQKPGKPEHDKLQEMYYAAVDGRLFAASLPERGFQGRQIIVNSQGQVDVLPDTNHPTEDMLKATPCPVKPTKPVLKSAGFKNRFLAFFGNKKAKDICRSVDKTNADFMRSYQKLKADY